MANYDMHWPDDTVSMSDNRLQAEIDWHLMRIEHIERTIKGLQERMKDHINYRHRLVHERAERQFGMTILDHNA